MSPMEIAMAVESNPLWYHTIDLAPGVVTPGWFDLRPIVDRIPWPEVRGQRCLDVATYDGFLAFEMDRRGAREVVAIDLASHEDWDWLPRGRAGGLEYLRQAAGVKGRGFEIAASALRSSVDRQFLSVYALDPERVGMFDVVVCGSLLLHLRDPFRALEAIRRICRGYLVSVEQVDLGLSVLQKGRAVLRLQADNGQWLVPSVAGHKRMLDAAGFDEVRSVRPFAIPFGKSHPPVLPQSLADKARAVGRRAIVGGPGVPVSAVLCRPASL